MFLCLKKPTTYVLVVLKIPLEKVKKHKNFQKASLRSVRSTIQLPTLEGAVSHRLRASKT